MHQHKDSQISFIADAGLLEGLFVLTVFITLKCFIYGPALFNSFFNEPNKGRDSIFIRFEDETKLRRITKTLENRVKIQRKNKTKQN